MTKKEMDAALVQKNIKIISMEGYILALKKEIKHIKANIVVRLNTIIGDYDAD